MNTKLVLAAMTVVLAGTPAAFAQMKTTHDRSGSEIGPSKTIQMEGRAADGSWSGNSWSTPMSGSTMSGSTMSNSGMSGSGMSGSGMSGSSGAAGVVPGVPTGSAEMGGQPPKTLQDRTGSEVGPSPEVLRNDPAFTPSNRSRAGSMSDGSRMGTTGSGMSGSTGMGSTSGMGNQQGYTGSTSGTVYGNQRNVTGSTTPSDIQSRRGRGQNDLELRQTSLLNQFSGAGYIAVRDFRKEGDRYVAQAQDQTGRWAAVEMDPRTGTITPR